MTNIQMVAIEWADNKPAGAQDVFTFGSIRAPAIAREYICQPKAAPCWILEFPICGIAPLFEK
jgi:hypothetical protein